MNALSPEQLVQLLATLDETNLDVLERAWELFLHRHQIPPAGDWTTWLLLGGRGAGKTRAGAQWVKALACTEGAKCSPIALIGETEHDAREVMVEGVSGLLAVHERGERPTWIPSRRRLEWRSGAVAQVFSAEDPESLRGPQFAAAWCDELAKWRHGYTNHPSDPGGPTNFGITIADYRRYAKRNATADDVRAMGIGEAKAIYKSRYWMAQSCDALPPGLDYTIFDYGVNSGVARSGKVLRRILGLPSNTAAITDEVLRAVAERDLRTLIGAVNDERLAFLKGLKTWPVFGAGWARRVAEVRAAALRMAEVAPKEKVQSTSAQETTVGTVAVAGAAAAAAQQAHSAGAEPAIVAAIVVVTIMLALGGWFAWRWHRRRQRPQSDR